MGFLDNLRTNAQTLNQVEPLFGGLIPRREVFMPERQMIREPTAFNPQIMPMPRKRGLEKAAEAFAMNEQQQPMDVVYDYRPELAAEDRKLKREQLGIEAELGRGKLGLERNKFGYEGMKDAKEFGLKSEIDRAKVDVDRRKQALDEWKSKNPEGEIKTDKDGRLVIISKLTGKTIDTGLKSNDFSDEEKQKRDFLGREKLEVIKGEQDRLTEIIKKENEKPERISQADQRTAEDDAAAELLRDKRYSWLLDEGNVTLDKDGLKIKRPVEGQFMGASKTQVDDANKVIDQFEKDIQTKATERLNRTFIKPNETPKVDDSMVDMLTPDGRPMKVPKGDVEKMKALKATVVEKK
jgi:hypothetical protein